jgi:class 3 adenylate cyclase
VDESPQTHYVAASDGVTLAYDVLEGGPLDVMWLPLGSYPFELLWDEPGFVHFARRMARFSRTIWFAHRGLGASGGHVLDNWAADGSDRTFPDDMARILDACDCEKVAVAGPGLSGPFAIAFARAYPDRTESLILIDSFAHYVRRPGYPIGYPMEEIERWYTPMSSTWGTGALVDVVAPSRSADAKFRERLARVERLGLPRDEWAEANRSALGKDVRDLLPDLNVPTLVLHRQGDRFIRVEAGRYLAASIPGARYVELPGEDYLYFVGDVDLVADEVEDFLTGGHQAPEGRVVTATVVFTDIVSSTEQTARLGHRRWNQLSEEHDTLVRSTLQRYGGQEVKTTGDGFVATFDATSRALRAAAEITNAAGGMGLQVRAGVHVGEIEVRPDDITGLAVNIAKRVCDLAGPGEVLVSETVPRLVTGSGMAFDDRGQHELRGVPDSWRLFALTG